MSNLLAWPSKYFFYAIGNTSAVSLTVDLSIDEPARMLLLGCGDPRNVLYTIFTEPQNSHRALDFTCCDFDPAVLARNVLLFTMIADDLSSATIWNIFFHFRLDKVSHSTLVEQCKKLIELSETPKKWNASPYASSLRMCTDYSLAELRRHWMLYVDMQGLPKSRLAAISDAFERQSKRNLKKYSANLSASRSLGPIWFRGGNVVSESFRNFWKNGVTFVDGKSITSATLLNPTFVYSLGGEGCSLHYGTDPLIPFHLAPLFANTKGAVSTSEFVKAAKAEFTDWCLSYRKSYISSSPAIVRFFVGEATAVCRSLHMFHNAGTLKLGVPVAQWKTQVIQLNKDEYTVSGGAPASFNVIHTSNLEDHIGLLNVLIASIPLLSQEASSVLYAESLLFLGQDATKEFTEHLHADPTIIAFLLGLCPVDYLCGFATRSNTHELMLLMGHKKKETVTQFHQVTTWKWSTSGDIIACRNAGSVLVPMFDPNQLGTLLYDIYQSIFEQETSKSFWAANQANLGKAIAVSNLAHYTREAFVLFIKLIKDRLRPTNGAWSAVMQRFISLQLGAWSIESMNTLYYQDLCAHLKHNGLYTAEFFLMKASKTGRFSGWDTVPDIVRIILVVPRERLAVLRNSKAEEVGTPPLHCDIFGRRSLNIFSSIHVALGRVISVGTKLRPQVIFEEDIKGWAGDSPLVVSFTAPALLLSDLEPPEALSIGFGVRNTPAACQTLIKKLGYELRLFSAKLMDESLVHVLPESPLPSRYRSEPVPLSAVQTQISMLSQIGKCDTTTSVELDEQCELITALVAHMSVTDEDSLHLFSSEGSKVVPEITQISPCIIRVNLGGRIQDVAFPFPVIGSAHRLRLARKSQYIEVIVPPSRSLKPDGMKINPYPVINAKGHLYPWSIHRVNLSTSPILDVKKAGKLDQWFKPHVGSMMSNRERSLRKKQQDDPLMFVKDTLNSIFSYASGLQSGSVQRVFLFTDRETHNCDTILFISSIKFDLASHTIICDGYVLPLTENLLMKIAEPFGKIVHDKETTNFSLPDGEMKQWKQLLPAVVERCRHSWTHGPNCEYMSSGVIPLAEDMEADPLCSCGRGNDVEGMLAIPLWRKLAPYVTRIALSPLFAVSYLEAVGRDPEARKCSVCRRKGKPRVKECTGCRKVRYCSPECQKNDWKTHKAKCKP
ncbi:hypothetical protein BDQ12DRAFT_766428 [Crucibulum laeve]|uniref:MYND-type domain-containing protein n=1 Tax=Crucibulum laeve TaxID=68775 RepID=A0A5C3LNP2_9AGAR|nr:hypothetical protein BDQ12DRAFT_766428 [Crucibulum laeve]